MDRSDATWKLWANTIPATAFRLDLSRLGEGRSDTIIWPDSWDGYPVERRELMRHLVDRGITNVIVLAGDRHAHFASLLMDDYDAAAPQPVAPEFTVAGINAVSRIVVFELQTRQFPEINELVVADGAKLGLADPVPMLNMTLRDGALSARIASRSGNLAEARRHANPAQNPHLAYADTHAYGYGVVRVAAEKATFEYVTFAPLLVDTGDAGAEPLRRTTFEIAAWQKGAHPRLIGPRFSGIPPFPLDASS
jgi:alkaline phosphatase D